ncbi:hypothetical protein LLEC1_01507 [Akanthomyces lecanii]|uniref:Transcription factor domain-containing protein n=1 Tax=Cordyceps confragosa TaxID=2714763 RepID=A0A179IIE7_CORDF|nr:hypothetical protein LLEC1_01507 [Akanthomyces lecanii]
MLTCKIQCSIPGPGVPCDWCSNQEIPCTFTRPPQKRKHATTPDAVHALRRRVEQLEADLARRNAEGQLASPESDATGTETSAAAQAEFSAQEVSESESVVHSPLQLGRSWYFRGMQILSKKGQQWIESKTGQIVHLKKYVTFDGVGRPTASSQASRGLALERALPEKHATHALVDAFFKHSVHPVLDRTLIDATVEEAYCRPQCLAAQACVWALHTWSFTPFTKVQTCDAEAAVQSRLLLEKLGWEPSLDALQAIILLVYRRSYFNAQNGLLHAAACQMACDLRNAFLQDSKKPDTDRKRRHLDNLFGFCYILDKDNALRSGQPPRLTEEYCDSSAMEAGATSIHPDLRLSLVKERTCRLLYSQKAAKLSDGDILQYIRQLDDELEQWRLSVPVSMRPRLSTPDSATEDTDRELIHLQLDYHYTLIAIHTMVRRCGASNKELPEDLHSVVHSSVDLSLEAGRSTLTFLNATLSLLGRQAFRHILSYAPVAAMALFVDILVHPLSKSAQVDLDTMRKSVDTFQTILVNGAFNTETRQMQSLIGFIMELVRLASCAISKAGQASVG